MHRRHITAHRLASQQPVQLVHQLPALQVQRFGHRAGLEGTGLDAQERRGAAVAGRQHAQPFRLAGPGQFGAGVVEVDVVDGQRVRPRPPVPLQQPAHDGRHGLRAARDGHVLHRQQPAPAARADHLCHGCGLGLGDLEVGIGKDDHVGVAGGIRHRGHGGEPCDGERVGRYVHGDRAIRHGPCSGGHMPAHHGDAALRERRERRPHLAGIAAHQHDAAGLQRQRGGHGATPALGRTACVVHVRLPPDHARSFLDALGNAKDAAVTQVFAHDGKRDVGPRARARRRAIPRRAVLAGARDDLLHARRVGQRLGRPCSSTLGKCAQQATRT
ncbi:hypothetical protein R77591_01034 [Ralstonia mannitolilytica]|uniref:Uncharacterized protein n=1 Tax=Ralstonia mannitolilytica TaxID=105219 RepID=A0AAD2EET3_9RALS|nr:hypothetical protein R77591_01034 [Ralstonia mannitolilytica]CAJ0861975.1 hypothetical protein R77569_01483 [Ralstonia mannitolilytica]